MTSRRADTVRRAVDAAGRAISAALETRYKAIVPAMLNSAGSVSAEWYVETLWHYLARRSWLQGVSSIDVEFKHPARVADKQLHFALPHRNGDDLAMDFHVIRRSAGARRAENVTVAHVTVHLRQHRHRPGVAPDPPWHPYGIEVRTRHLNAAGHVSWYTLVAATMDVARRGAQFADERLDLVPDSLLYIVPRFSFTPLADAALCDNLFVYPHFELVRTWIPGKTSAAVRVTMWAVATSDPWPIAESVVSVVRTLVVDGARRPVDEVGAVKSGR